jgi:hypothetical protein
MQMWHASWRQTERERGSANMYMSANEVTIMHKPNAARASVHEPDQRPTGPHRLQYDLEDCHHYPREISAHTSPLTSPRSFPAAWRVALADLSQQILRNFESVHRVQGAPCPPAC